MGRHRDHRAAQQPHGYGDERAAARQPQAAPAHRDPASRARTLGLSPATKVRLGSQAAHGESVFGVDIVKVKEPQPPEVALLEPRHTLFTYLHLAADPERPTARSTLALPASPIKRSR